MLPLPITAIVVMERTIRTGASRTELARPPGMESERPAPPRIPGDASAEALALRATCGSECHFARDACVSGHETHARKAAVRPRPSRSGDPGQGAFWENAVGQAALDDALRARACLCWPPLRL